MTLAAIRTGLYTLLTASGPWISAEISTCSFDVLESTSGCALTFFPDGTTEIEPLTFGTNAVMGDMRHWRIGGTLWIRDTTNPETVLNAIWQGYDDLYTTIRKDNTLGGVCDSARLESIANRLDEFRMAGGHLWKPVNWVVLADEF